MTLTLFQHYPKLRTAIPHTPLGSYPTPIERLILPSASGHDVWIKRDDQTGALYGGNKVRKLEFVLGDALHKGHSAVWTLGAIGSHHALATALYANTLNLNAHILHVPQPITAHVRQNLLAIASTGANLTLANNVTVAAKALWHASKHRLPGKHRAYAVPLGGTDPQSTLGHVNAALELADQIKAGQLPTPHRIYVPVGTCGTLAGLWLGCRIAGLQTEVIGVRVVPWIAANRFVTARLIHQTSALLSNHCPNIPRVRVSPRNITLLHGYYGQGYGEATPQGEHAIELFEKAGLPHLDPTYTGKTASALLGEHTQATGPVLFWNTLSSVDLNTATNSNALPAAYQPFFTPESP